MSNIKTIVLVGLFSSAVLIGCSNPEETTAVSKDNALKTLKANLEKNEIPVKVVSLEQSAHPDFYLVTNENHPPIYASKDGKLVIPGPIVNIDAHPAVEISEKMHKERTAKALAAVAEQDIISYLGKDAKHSIYVFTDASCSFCRSLHPLVKDLNAKGVNVHYLAFPRGPEFKPLMEQIWCSDDRKAAYEKAIKDQKLTAESCKNPVDEQLKLGQDLGVDGTPAIFHESGIRLPSFDSADQMLEVLSKIKE